MPSVLEFVDAAKAFGGQHVLSELNLHLSPNEVLSLVGPSGCGKTTTLWMAAGLLKSDPPGKVIWYRAGEPVEVPIRPVAIVFQGRDLLPWRTVRANVSLPLELSHEDAWSSKYRVEEALEQVRLATEHWQKLPHELSGGMKTRVALARALVVDSPLMLLDEPLAHLDAFAREELLPLFVDLLGKSKRAVLYVTHDLEDAVFLGDRVLVFKEPARGDYREIDVPRDWERTSSLRRSGCFQRVVDEVRASFWRPQQ